jgi:hypothetical protein
MIPTPARTLGTAIHPLIVLIMIASISGSTAAQQPDELRGATQERIRTATTVGEQHEALARFVGEWDVEITLMLPGVPEQHASGRATYEWLIPGRWIGQRLTDELMGEPHESFAIIGYDNFAKNYVIAGVSSFDTALNVSRGPVVDPEGGVIVTYGTQNDYTTGVLHKPYRIVTRIIDKDRHVVETWDMGIGPDGAAILEYRYTRRPR